MEDLILPPESDTGNIEYKLSLASVSIDTLVHRITQMKYRLREGNGEAIYYIGISDSGLPVGISEDDHNKSIEILTKMVTENNCSIIEVFKKQKNDKKIYSQYVIRDLLSNYIDLKIGVVGNVDSGKSTLIGCLTKDVLDDGRGKSRLLVFNYPHEVKTGRTSSIGHQIMGFDKNGNFIKPKKLNHGARWTDITKNSSKIVSFYDMAGHERYLRTTIYGLTSMHPDYCFVVIGGNMGMNHMTREHIALCISLQIPIIIIITKIDIAPANIMEETMLKLKKVCKNAIRKIPYEIKTYDDVININHNIKAGNIIPIFKISNVGGHNLDLLKKTLNLLPVRNDYSHLVDEPIEMLVDSKYFITGHGTVVSGLLKSGTIKVNDTLYLGPCNIKLNNKNFNENYVTTRAKSIHIKHLDVKEAKAGSYICICLKNINKNLIRKGAVLLGEKQPKLSINEFIANVNVLHSHHTTIKKGYQPYLHIEQVRQCAQILEIINKDEILRTGDMAKVRLRFINRPEYIKPGMKLIFRDGKVKAVGRVIENVLD